MYWCQQDVVWDTEGSSGTCLWENNVFILEQVQGKTGRVISRTENLS